MNFMYSCIINWLQFDSNSSFTFSCVCLIYKNDSFVLYTCLVEIHFWLVNPDHVLAIRLLTSKVKFEPWRRDLISESGVYPLEISYHNLLYVTMKLKNKRPPLKCIRMRDYKRLDQDKFQSDIESAPFHIGSIFDNADTRLWVWQKLYFNICDEHAPWKQVIVSNKSVTWITNDIRYEMNGRLKIYKTAIMTKSSTSRQEYKKARNEVTSALKNA